MKRWGSLIFVATLYTIIATHLAAQPASGQIRHAVVIGNSKYLALPSLRNPGNDASDMAEALRGLGFQVDLLLNADLVQMESAIAIMKSRLSVTPSAIGLFYYAGHGVQSNGNNYLIPSDANIQDEAYLRTKALSAQAVLDVLQQSGNNLNIVILDACRDNPFGWARSGSKGLSVEGNQPPGSIVVYATSAGSTAQDGMGRNGVFTSELLKNIAAPSVEINEVFHRTGAGVQAATAGKQIPAVYNQFFGKAYLSGDAIAAISPKPPVPLTLSGSLLIRAESAGTLCLDGKAVGDIRKGGAKRLAELEVGYYDLEIRYSTGERESRSIAVEEGKETEVQFLWKTTVSSTATMVPPTATTPSPVTAVFSEQPAGQAIAGDFFTVGSTKDEVIAIQGTPTRFSEQEWQYGYSKIFFTNGRVSSWDITELSPLKAIMKPAKPVDPLQEYFTVGSTKDVVIAVQGTPTKFDDRVWQYGYSKVFFNNGLVSRWEESPFDPIRAR